MTVGTGSINQYDGTGSQTEFPYTFKIFADNDIVVVYTDTNGIDTTWTLNTQYTVTNAGEQSGGNVVVKDIYAPPTGSKITIYRELALVQETDFVEGSAFLAEINEEVADRSIMISQQLDRKIGLSLVAPESDGTSIDLELPNASDRANSFLGFDSDGEPYSIAGVSEVSVSTFMRTLLDDTDYTTGCETLRIEDWLNDVYSLTISGSDITISGDVDITGNIDTNNLTSVYKVQGDRMTLTVRDDDPTNVVDKFHVYAKNVNGKGELFIKDEDGNVLQLTSSGTAEPFPAGTKMYFYQDTAPLGWVYVSAVTDGVLAVKGGSQAYNVDGGTGAGSWTISGLSGSHTHTGPSHTHTGPSHTHSVTIPHSGWSTSIDFGAAADLGSPVSTGEVGRVYADKALTTVAGGTGNTGAGGTGNTGGASAHPSQNGTWRPAAAIGIICEKS